MVKHHWLSCVADVGLYVLSVERFDLTVLKKLLLSGTDCEDAVVDTETTVDFGRPAFGNLRHEDARVAGYVLIVHAARYAET